MSQSALEPHVPAAAKLVSVDGRLYPLESAHLLARAEGGIASTTLVQTYSNPYDDPLEVVYTMPLPADGAVTGYTIRVGERVIRGEVQPREKASAAYKKALFEGRVAGLLEEQRPDTFEQKLGNVPPHTHVQVSIDVLHPLAFLARSPRGFDVMGVDVDALPSVEQPEWEYRFPTVVGVRYHGASGRVNDQNALSPDRGKTPAKVQLSLTIADDAAPHASSTSHRIEFSPNGAVMFAGDESLDRDVVVRWPAAQEQVGVRIVEGTGLEGDAGRYALVTLVPPANPSAVLRREVTVLLDASGSMDGLPLELAKVVVGDLLRSLAKGDRFELLAFANSVTRLTRGFESWSNGSLEKALRALEAVQASGGTEMESAVAEAMKGTGEGSQHQVVLVTDGQIGFEAEVVGRVAAQQNVRLHVVGVGHVPNRSLTQRAASAGRGLELLASSHVEANAAARRLVSGTAGPVLTQVSVSGTAITGEPPSALRDVFAGRPLLFTVELSREGGTLDISGTLAGSRHAWVHRTHVPATGANDALVRTPLPLGALFGRELVSRLEIDHAGVGYRARAQQHRFDAAALDSLIEQVAMRHRIVSRRTSLVAMAEEPSMDPREPRMRTRLAVEVPAGVSAERLGLEVAEDAFLGAHSILDAAVLFRSRRPMAAAPKLGASLLRRVFGSPLTSADARPLEHQIHSAPLELQVAEARWFAPGLLVIELVLPFEGFVGPGGPIQFAHELGDGRIVSLAVEFVPEMSTEPGSGTAGRIVKLALRLVPEPTSVEAGVFVGESIFLVRGSDDGPVEVPVRFRLDVPEPLVGGAPPPDAGSGR